MSKNNVVIFPTNWADNEVKILNIPTTDPVRTTGCEPLSSSSLGGLMSDLNT